MVDRSDRVNRWLMGFILDNPDATHTVEDLAKACRSQMEELQSLLLTWQEVAEHFMHALTTHHMHHGRLTQHKTDPDIPGNSPSYILQLGYRLTNKGRSDFPDLLQTP